MTYIGHYHVLGCGKRGPRSKCDHRLYFKGISITNHFKLMIFFFFLGEEFPMLCHYFDQFSS